MDERITYFAQTDARNKRTPFGIKAKDRSRHMYVIGKTGMGKSTLLENMAVQDMRNGEGLAFIDPHGATAEKLLEYVPENRIKDVLYLAPFNLEHPVSFNIMEDVDPDKRHLVVNGLMSTFEKIWVDMWSARMAYILQNTLLALLEHPGSTLLGVNRMYTDKEYRKQVVASVTDPSVKAFWNEEYAKYTDRFAQEATPAIQNKIGQFSANPLIRNMIGQPTSSFDMREIMDKRKILIVNLSKGRVGEGNASLLGSMLVTKIYLAALSRADSSHAALQKLPNFYLYVDEFQSFANKSFEDILSEARKYKLNLTIAHQYIEQMEEEVRAAVFGNVGTMVVFRVGAYDAEIIEKEFAPVFTMEDIVNLGFAQVYLKLMIDGVTSQPFSATTLPPLEPPARSFRNEIIESSNTTYGRPRATVEEEIKKWHEPIVPSPAPVSKTQRREESRDAVKETHHVRPQSIMANALPLKEAIPISPRVPDISQMRSALGKIAVQQGVSTEKPLQQSLKDTISKVVANQPPVMKSPSEFQKKDTKGSTPQDKTALREALGTVLNNSYSSLKHRPPVPHAPTPVSQVSPRASVPGVQPSVKPNVTLKPQAVPIGEPRKETREVPEKILRDLLKVDDDPKV